MTVTSRPTVNGKTEEERAPRKRQPPKIGFLRPGTIERAFMGLLYLALGLLVVLSVVGTFYGQRGTPAPLTRPLQIIADVQAGGILFALVVQGVLTVAQWGSRQLARHDRRWWLLYLAALLISVYYNVQAYWIPLNELVPMYVAVILIIAGDALPEFLAVRHE